MAVVMQERTIKKILLVLLVVVLALLFFRMQKSFFVDSTPVRQSVPVQATPLRLGLNIPEGTALHAAALRFAEVVATRSEGQLHVSVHPNQELGTDDQMLELAKRGELPLVLIPTSKLGIDIPAMQVLDLPFYFPSREVLYRALDQDLGRILLDKMREIGLEGVTFWENGFKNFTANQPIHAPQDFANLRVRVMKSRVIMEQFKLFKAVPVSIDFHATKQALANGEVVAQENPLSAIVSMGFHEVQSHLTLSSHAYLGYVFAISQKFLATLSGQQQQMLVDVAKELTAWEREETRQREVGFLATIRQAGVTVHTLTDQERAGFVAAVIHLSRKFEEMIGPDVIAKCDEWIRLDAASQLDKKPILIGLDAQLSGESLLAGLELSQGAALAIQDINVQGGVLGRQLQLIRRDHYGLATRGVENIRFFAGLDNLVAVVGGQSSGVAGAEIDLIHRFGLPYLLPWSAAQELTDNGYTPNFVFRVSLNDRWTVPFLVDAALLRGKRVALVVENSNWGHRIEKNIQHHVLVKGGVVEGVYWVEDKQTSFENLVTRIGDIGADVVILVDTPDESMGFLQALSLRFPSLPVISHWSLLGSKMTAAQMRMVEKIDLLFPQTVFSSFPATLEGSRLLQQYKDHLQLEADVPVSIGSGFAHAYDLVHMLAQAIRNAGSLDRQAVRTALERLPVYAGVVKRYALPFDQDRHDALQLPDYRLGRMTGEGRIRPVNHQEGQVL